MGADLITVTIWGVFSAGIARDLPIGVVDLQHSQLSRKMIQSLDASSTLSVDYHYTSSTEAKNAMIEGDIYAYAVIPPKFDQDILLHRQPQLSVFFNSQYILVAKLINSAVAQSQGYFDAQLETMGNLARGIPQRLLPLVKQCRFRLRLRLCLTAIPTTLSFW